MPIALTNLWRQERLGLTMIVSSIAVIAVSIALLMNFSSAERIEQLRLQGSTLSKLLADLPFEELSTRRRDYSPLRLLQLGQDDADFAYAVFVDSSGELLNAVNSPVIDVTRIATDVPQGVWSGERQVTIPGTGRSVLEFFSPVVDGNEVQGTIRVAYFQPGFGLRGDQLTLVATLALTIFLLTPLFYFTVRREIRPLKAVNEEIAERIKDGQLGPYTIEATGELREFIDRFNRLTALARNRIEALEQNNNELVTSQKLLGYRKMRIEAVLKAIPEAVLILGEDGSVTYANGKVEDLLGVRPAEILHRKPSEWCQHPEALGFLSRFEKTATANFFSDTMRLNAPLDARRKLSIKAYPLFAPQDPNAVFGRLILLRDVTKEVLAEQGRSNFVAHVSHELKSPLNTLGLYAEALQGEQGEDGAFRVEAYNVIADEVERLASLVDNLLSITKIEMGNLKVEKQRVRLQDLLRDAFNHVNQAGKAKGLRFELDMPPELSAVAVDKDLLRIAINNVLVNAVKYTPTGGRVSMTATETETAFEIRIADTGIGISAEDQDRIFEKFFRSEDQKVREISGHGLGLPLAREIVELHRGQLTVSSAPGKGSEFLIQLWKDSGLLKQAI